LLHPLQLLHPADSCHTLNPQPSTLNPQPSTVNHASICLAACGEPLARRIRYIRYIPLTAAMNAWQHVASRLIAGVTHALARLPSDYPYAQFARALSELIECCAEVFTVCCLLLLAACCLACVLNTTENCAYVLYIRMYKGMYVCTHEC